MLRVVVSVAAALSIAAGSMTAAMFSSAPAAAEPPPICDGPGLPPCAHAPDALTPEQRCAMIAYQSWQPCNWVNPDIKVPEGTPGSM